MDPVSSVSVHSCFVKVFPFDVMVVGSSTTVTRPVMFTLPLAFSFAVNTCMLSVDFFFLLFLCYLGPGGGGVHPEKLDGGIAARSSHWSHTYTCKGFDFHYSGNKYLVVVK